MTFAGVAVVTAIVWMYAGALWDAHLLVRRTFTGLASWYFYTWGFDALLLLAGGGLLAAIIRSDRPVLWGVLLGALFSALRIVLTRWVGLDDIEGIVWNLGVFVVPLLSATCGALATAHLLQWARRDGSR